MKSEVVSRRPSGLADPSRDEAARRGEEEQLGDGIRNILGVTAAAGLATVALGAIGWTAFIGL